MATKSFIVGTDDPDKMNASDATRELADLAAEIDRHNTCII